MGGRAGCQERGPLSLGVTAGEWVRVLVKSDQKDHNLGGGLVSKLPQLLQVWLVFTGETDPLLSGPFSSPGLLRAILWTCPSAEQVA